MRARIGRLGAAAAVVVLLAAGCGGDDDDAAEAPPVEEPTAAQAAEEPTNEPVDATGDDAVADDTEEPTAEPEEPSAASQRALQFGEAFIDAYYGFERRTVQLAVINASETSQGLANYGVWWAETLGTELVERIPCEARGFSVTCDVLVRDALTDTLGIDEPSVVRWLISLNSEGNIEEVRLIPDDPPELDAAYNWVIANRPGLFDDGDCAGFFATGQTPVECAGAVLDAFGEYAATLG